jgi:hypothetical protein
MPLPDDPTPKRKLTAKQKKYIVVDFAAQESDAFDNLDNIKKYIQERTDVEGQNADWAVNNFMVYEIKEQILFTAQEEISIKFGIG